MPPRAPVPGALLPPPALGHRLLDARLVAPHQRLNTSTAAALRYNTSAVHQLIAETSETSCLTCNCTSSEPVCARPVLCPQPLCYVGLCQTTSETLYCYNCGYLDGFTPCFAPPPPPPPPPVSNG